MRLLISIACLFLVWNSPAFSDEPVSAEKKSFDLFVKRMPQGNLSIGL